MRKISFLGLLTLFLSVNPAQAAQQTLIYTQNQPLDNQLVANDNFNPPVEPTQKQKVKKWAKKHSPPKAQERMFPNSFAWTGVLLLILGILLGLIFGGTIGTIASVIAAIGLIFIVVWIIQRLSYM